MRKRIITIALAFVTVLIVGVVVCSGGSESKDIVLAPRFNNSFSNDVEIQTNDSVNPYEGMTLHDIWIKRERDSQIWAEANPDAEFKRLD